MGARRRSTVPTRGAYRPGMPPVSGQISEVGTGQFPPQGPSVREPRGDGQGPSGEKSPAFPRLSTPSLPHPAPPPLNPKQAGGRGAPGAGWPGGSAFVAQCPTAAARQRGRGRGPETLSRGLTPRCIVRRGPPPSPGRDPVATVPPSRPLPSVSLRRPRRLCGAQTRGQM